MSERPRDQYFDMPEKDPTSGEHLDEQVQKAEQTEQTLRRQLEIIERQKRELEELSRRQEQLQTGKSEMVDRLTRALVILEREIYEANKRVELLQNLNVSFATHLETLEAINPKEWEGLDMNKELTRALACVDDSRAEYSKSYPKIGVVTDQELNQDAGGGYTADYGSGGDKDFMGWMRAGFAFTLPLIIIGIALVLILLNLVSK